MLPPKIDASFMAPTDATPEQLRRRMEVEQVRKNLTPGESEEKRLKEATEGFESMFINQLWKQMRKSIPKEGYLHSKEEDSYLSMFDQEFSKKMAQAGGIGLGQMLFDELKSQLVGSSRKTSAALGQAGEGIPIARQNEVDSLKEAGIRVPKPDRRHIAPPEVPDTRVEPDFDPLANTSPKADPAPVKVPSQVMNSAMNLATRIEMQRSMQVAQTGQTEGAPAADQMHWPVEGLKKSGFGWRTDEATGSREWHSGVDIAGAEGDPVQACWPGTVVFAGERGRYGNTVVVEHEGGWRSTYGHNSENLVSVGDQVAAGSNIARVGQTGSATEPELHFEIRKGEQAVDPENIRERLQAGLSIK